MSDDITGAQWVCALAQARGLARAYELYPETVTAAVERANHAFSPPPTEFSLLTEPAVTFDPAWFGESA